MNRPICFCISVLFSFQANALDFDLQFSLNPIGTYASGKFGESAAEIVAYDPLTKRVFVVNALDASVDVLDINNPATPLKIGSIDATAAGVSLGAANSVAVSNGLLAVAIERTPKQVNGIVAFYNAATLELLRTVDVGALPDMLVFTPDGSRVIVANEGEPNDTYDVDPEGSISIIDLRRGLNRATVETAGFTQFNDDKDELVAAGVRIFGPSATVAQDLEPEYIAVDATGSTAYVTLQDNNALALVDIRRARVKEIVPLGYKDFSEPGNELDASNKDDAIIIRSWPVLGMYQPDAIETYVAKGKTYIVTANEGDSRDYPGFSEEVRIKDLLADEGKTLDPTEFPNRDDLLTEPQLGRLKITKTLGDADGDSQLEQLYAFGARSFSIRDDSGKLIWDSGNAFESITANLIPDNFNSTNDENGSFDDRSDDKGPEPEALAIGKILGRTYAFIGLERVGGIMMYDITDQTAPSFVTYANNRDFSVLDVEQPEAGDLGPEGIRFVPWYESPNWRPLLIVGNEVSGTTTIFQIDIEY
jgi:hypothetical protein